MEAVEESYKNNWGIETDIRDFDTKLVISHDIATSASYSVDKIFSLYHTHKCDGCLALNIKADGLSGLLNEKLQEFAIENYFVFDMSIPETLRYISLGMNVFIRCSEYETPNEELYNKSAGIWLDAFTEIWYDKNYVHSHLQKGKKIAIVSPELHGRNYTSLWEMIRMNKWHQDEKMLLCTDLPDEAKTYFNV